MNLDLMRADKPRITFQQFEVFSLFDSFQTTFAKALDHSLFAGADFGHVDLDVSALHSVIGGATRQIGNSRAIEHCLRRCAANVYARAADMLAFDDCGSPSGFAESLCQRIARLTRTNHDCVESFWCCH